MPSRESAERRIRQKAKEHGQSCGCKTCRAASGDEQALNSLLNELV